jgi:hypothetical protein
VLAVETDAAAIISAIDVDTGFVASNILIITTFHRMTITLTWFADIFSIEGGWSPTFLDKTWAASVTLFATSVVHTSADQLKWIARISHITDVSVTIAHTSTTD